MRTELLDAGLAVEVAVVNMTGYDASITNLTSKGPFPVFQDSAAAGVWAMHGGTKDDMIVYDPQGKVHTFFDYGGVLPSNLSTATGYDAVKAAWISAATP